MATFTNEEAGQTIKELRDRYQVPADVKGDDRERWLRDTMTESDFADYINARNILIETNRGFVLQQAFKFATATNGNADPDDLASGATLMLLNRVWDWDADKGAFTTFATQVVRKGMQIANDAGSPFEKKTNRENILEAIRLLEEMPGASPEERAAASKLSHFRNSPNAVQEWTAIASGWSNRIEINSHDFDSDDENASRYQVAAPIGRGLADADALMRLLVDLLGPEDALIMVLTLGLDDHSACSASQVVSEAQAINPGFPTLKREEVEARIASAMDTLRSKGDEVRHILVPA